MKRDLNTKILTVALLFSFVSAGIFSSELPEVFKYLGRKKSSQLIQTAQELFTRRFDPKTFKEIDILAAQKTKKLIFQQRENPLEADQFDMLPLMWAARNNGIETVKTLLSSRRVKANINRQDSRGNTALSHAAMASNGTGGDTYVEVVKELLEIEGTDPNIRNKEGKSALTYAIEGGNAELIPLLMQFGAKITPQDQIQAEGTEYARRMEELYRLFNPTHLRFSAGPANKSPYQK